MSAGTPLRALTLGVALGEEAAHVHETQTNWSDRIGEYLARCNIRVPAPWCAAFVATCAGEAAERHGLRNPIEGVARKALVADYYSYARERHWIVRAEEALPGDLVIYDFPGGHLWGHIGLVVEPPGADGNLRAIEGNTDDDGGREGVEVAQRDRTLHGYPVAFARWDCGVVLP